MSHLNKVGEYRAWVRKVKGKAERSREIPEAHLPFLHLHSAVELGTPSSVWSFESQLRCHLQKEGLLELSCAWQLLIWLLTVWAFKEGKEIIFKYITNEKNLPYLQNVPLILYEGTSFFF